MSTDNMSKTTDSLKEFYDDVQQILTDRINLSADRKEEKKTMGERAAEALYFKNELYRMYFGKYDRIDSHKAWELFEDAILQVVNEYDPSRGKFEFYCNSIMKEKAKQFLEDMKLEKRHGMTVGSGRHKAGGSSIDETGMVSLSEEGAEDIIGKNNVEEEAFTSEGPSVGYLDILGYSMEYINRGANKSNSKNKQIILTTLYTTQISSLIEYIEECLAEAGVRYLSDELAQLFADEGRLRYVDWKFMDKYYNGFEYGELTTSDFYEEFSNAIKDDIKVSVGELIRHIESRSYKSKEEYGLKISEAEKKRIEKGKESAYLEQPFEYRVYKVYYDLLGIVSNRFTEYQSEFVSYIETHLTDLS